MLLIDKTDKYKLILITVILDIFLLLLYFDTTTRLNNFDKNFIRSMGFIHLLLYWTLYNNDRYSILYYLHLTLIISILFGMVLENMPLKFAILALLSLIQILWVLENKCIMGKFGYNKILTISTIIYYGLLSLRVGYEWGQP